MTKLSIAMITKNEEHSVGKVIDDIRHYVPDSEIVIVDSSDDATPKIAKAKNVTLIRQYPPRGYGNALALALESAKNDIIITLDCDNTYPTAEIPHLARLIEESNYDLVNTSRLRKKPQSMPLINYMANVGFSIFASILFFQKITDLHSGMRAYKRQLIKDISSAYHPNGAAFPVELLLLPLCKGKKIKTVSIDYNERIGDSKMNPMESAWWTIKRIFRARFVK